MTASPVLAQVEPVLREAFQAAQKAGQVPQDVLFRIVSLPVEGNGDRDYYCAGTDDKPIPVIKPVRAKPTICD